MRILCINAGSATLKYAVFLKDAAREEALEAHTLSVTPADDAVSLLARVLSAPASRACDAVAHRVVFGGPEHNAPVRITPEVRARIEALRTYDDLHLVPALHLIDAVTRELPTLPQVAAFDTAFHRRMPAVAKRLPIAKDTDPIVQRYGFHGLSYEYIVSALGKRAQGRMVVAHWGSGASLAALRDGEPVDTSMGFTPLSGMMMGTRPGDLDPGVVLFLLRTHQHDVARLTHALYHESGLAGVSGTTGDLRALEAASAHDVDAAAAVGLFVHTARKEIAALTAALGGIDRLVFTGGIGENSDTIRALVCAGLRYLGIEIDPARNDAHAECISRDGSAVVVNVIPTDENRMLARHAFAVLSSNSHAESDQAASLLRFS